MSGFRTKNANTFHNLLMIRFADVFANNPDYAYAASKYTPEQYADMIVTEITSGKIINIGEITKDVCKEIGIKPFWKTISDYVNNGIGGKV